MKLGYVEYKLEGNIIRWYVHGKLNGVATYPTDSDAQTAYAELERES